MKKSRHDDAGAASAPAPRGVFLVALGCPKNFVDSEVIAGSLAAAGWLLTPEPEEASLYVVNTCAFLPQARAYRISVENVMFFRPFSIWAI